MQQHCNRAVQHYMEIEEQIVLQFGSETLQDDCLPSAARETHIHRL